MPNQFRVTPVDVVGSITKGAQARNSLNQLKESERLTTSRNKLAEALSGGIPNDPAGRQQLISTAAQVDPEMALKVDAHIRSLTPDMLKQRTDEAPLMVGLFSDVNDDATYQISRNEALKFGIDDLPEVYDPRSVQASLHGYRALLPTGKDQSFTLGEGQVRYDRAGNELARGPEKAAKPPAPSALSKLIAERDALPEGDPNRAAFDAAIKKQTTPSSGTTVNVGSEVGTIPQGYELFTDPDTKARRLRAIEGGPVVAENIALEEKKAAGQKAKSTAARVVIQDIERVLEKVSSEAFPVTGLVGSLSSGVPGTSAHDVAALLDTIKANVGFDKLQAMRDASPTGGALGQVSEFENRLLQSALGSLQQSQSREQFVRNLNRLKREFQTVIHGPSAVTEGGSQFNFTSDSDPAKMGDDELEAYEQFLQSQIDAARGGQ